MSDQPKADAGKGPVSDRKFGAMMLETSSKNTDQPIETEENFGPALTQATKLEDGRSSLLVGGTAAGNITTEALVEKAGSSTAQNESPPNTIVNPLRPEGILGAGQTSPTPADANAAAVAKKVSPDRSGPASPAISPPSIPGINASIGEAKNTLEGNPEGSPEEETPIKIETRNEGESPRKGEGNAPITPTPGKDSSTITLMQSPTREASSAPVNMSDAMITPNLASAAIAQATPPSLLENSVVQRPLLTLSMQEPAQAANALARVIMSQSGAGDRISVQLDPPELGRLNLEFVFDGSRLQSVHVISDTPEMQQFLKRHGALLSQILADSGLGDASLSFENQRQQHNPFMDPQEKILSAHIQQTDETAMAASVIGDIPAPTNYLLSSDPIDIRA